MPRPHPSAISINHLLALSLVAAAFIGWLLMPHNSSNLKERFIESDPIKQSEAARHPAFENSTPPVYTNVTDGVQQGILGAVYGKLPLNFEVNEGQTDSRVKFLSRGSGYNLFLTSTEAVLALSKRQHKTGRESIVEQIARPQNLNPTHEAAEIASTNPLSDVLRLRLVGANPTAYIKGTDELPGKSNYFIGNDPAKWRRDISIYARVKHEGVYPGVDLVYYGNQGHLEFDLIVAPHADYKQIKLRYKGAKSIHIDEPSGDLILTTKDGGELTQQKPVIYQEIAGERRKVEGSYKLNRKSEVTFRIGEYDASQPLVIDPTLVYSTYIGGNFGASGDGIAVDAQGNAYITGSTFSTNFPTQNPFQANFGGGNSRGDAFVTKFVTSRLKCLPRSSGSYVCWRMRIMAIACRLGER